MTPDYRALISQMAAELDHCQQLLRDDRRQRHPLADRARTLLAEADGPAVPDGREPASVTTQPSDAELLATLDQAVADFPPRHPEAEAMNAVEYPLALELRKARAVLARWGRSTPQPVVASERLPGAEDCDEQGRCWWYGEGADMFGWTLDAEGASYYRAKFWLPAHALPTPEATND